MIKGAVSARKVSVYTMGEKNIKVYSNGTDRDKGYAHMAFGFFRNHLDFDQKFS
jgi:hypothetical protein